MVPSSANVVSMLSGAIWKLNCASPPVRALTDGFDIPEADNIAVFYPFGGFQKTFPVNRSQSFDKGYLNLGTLSPLSFLPMAHAQKPRRNNLGDIDHQRISGPQQVGQSAGMS